MESLLVTLRITRTDPHHCCCECQKIFRRLVHHDIALAMTDAVAYAGLMLTPLLIRKLVNRNSWRLFHLASLTLAMCWGDVATTIKEQKSCYGLCLKYITQTSENRLATQTKAINWQSHKAERAAICGRDWWMNVLGTLPFPIVWLFHQNSPVELTGIDFHGNNLPPLFSASAAMQSVCFFVLSRWYPFFH